MKERDKKDNYQLYLVAKDRLSPDAMAGWLVASSILTGIFLGITLVGVNKNIQLSGDIWRVISLVFIGVLIIQVIVMMFYSNIKNCYKYQKFLSLWVSIIATKMPLDIYLLIFAITETKGYTNPIAYITIGLILLGFIFLITFTIRGFKRLKDGEFRKDGNYLYDFLKSKKNIGVIAIFPVVLIVISIFKSFQEYGNGVVGISIFLIVAVIIQYTLSLAIPEIYLITYCKYKYGDFMVDIPQRLMKKINKKKSVNSKNVKVSNNKK